MERGFTSIILVIVLVPFMLNVIEVSNNTEALTISLKNKIILHQQLNEKKYNIEHGFETAVRKGIIEAELVLPDEVYEKIAPIIVCAKVRECDENFSVGVIDTNNMYRYDSDLTALYIIADSFVNFIEEDWPEFLLGLYDPCVKFISVDGDGAVVGINEHIDFNVNVSGFDYDIGFVFEEKLMDHNLTVVIPEGRCIQ